MTEIEILTECHDENVIVAIISAVQMMLESSGEVVTMPRLVRSGVNVPVWNFEARQNNLM